MQRIAQQEPLLLSEQQMFPGQAAMEAQTTAAPKEETRVVVSESVAQSLAEFIRTFQMSSQESEQK